MMRNLSHRLLQWRFGRLLARQGAICAGPVRASGLLPFVENQGELRFGHGVHLRGALDQIRLTTLKGGRLSIGDNVFVNTGARLYATDEIVIGDDSKIGDDCLLFDTSFHPVHEGQALRSKPIRIGRNVWLARGVVVLPGVSIGDHAVVSANAVVYDDVPARQVWRGNPATYAGPVHASDAWRRP